MLDKKNVQNKSVGNQPPQKKFVYPSKGVQVEASNESEARVIADEKAKEKTSLNQTN